MNRWIEWFAKNGVAANLMMALIIIAGSTAMFTTTREVFPEFSLDLITVTVPYLGAAPDEVENGVCIRVEEAIQGLDGIKKVTSNASEGSGTVVAELLLGADASKVLDDIKARVDAIDTFPLEAEKPIITEVTNRTQIIDIALFGDVSEKTLKVIAEEFRDQISAMPGITIVELPSARPYEIAIEVSEDALRQFNLTFDEVATAIRQSSLDIPGGSVKTKAGEILLRTQGQVYRGLEFEKLVLVSKPDGTRIFLGDVANVVDGFAETDQMTLFDGKKAILISVFRVGEQSALDIARKVRDFVRDKRDSLPAGVSAATWRDQSKMLKDRVDVLVRNGLSGLVLVFISLALFLRFRLAVWVSLGIPVSFLGAFWLMPNIDITINLISLFAFIVVLGIVVDDAIVTGENIYTHQQRHGDGLRGAIEGTREVAIPVTFGVLTTVAAFSPLMNVPGTIGKIMRIVPLIVVCCLIFSFVESKFILPNHLSHIPKPNPNKRPGLWRRFQDLFYKGLLGVVQTVYKPILERCLRWRYATMAAGLGALILSAGLIMGGWVRFQFFPSVESDYLNASITMPMGTRVTTTADAIETIQQAAEKLREDLRQEYGDTPLFQYISTAVGDQPYTRSQDRNKNNGASNLTATHLGEVTIELAPAEARPNVSSELLAQRWRDLTGPITDAVELTFSASLFSPGKPIDVQLTGPDLEVLNAAANQLKTKLQTFAGVYEVADSFREGKRELKLKLKPQAEVYGLNLADVGRQVRQAFYGEEAQRIQRGRDDIRVMVRYPKDQRESVSNLENMRLRTPGGLEVPFQQVAELDHGRGYSTITRVDRRRAVNVTAGVDATKVAAGDIIEELGKKVLPEIRRNYPSVLYSFEGEMAEQRDTMGGLQQGFALALIVIYALLAVPLRSYMQPFIIMTAIPFGLIGAVLGHIIMGMNLTILSMFGIVALAGVVVNDSLVLVDFINRHRNDGNKGLLIAVRDAGMARFRPILLTSITTFVGLLPLLLEESVQAQFLVPMAISLAFGVLFSTAISLVLVPAAYLALEDFHNLRRWLFKGSTKSLESEAPDGSPRS